MTGDAVTSVPLARVYDSFTTDGDE